MKSEEEKSPPPRKCDSCYVCCVALGITELKKHMNQTCKNLTGTNGPNNRCGIYQSRPHACSRYNCSWIEGLGDDEARPDKSGVLCTLYPSKFPGIDTSATLLVHDPLKAGPWQGPGKLFDLLKQLMEIGCDKDVRIISPKQKQTIHFHNGTIRQGKLFPQEEYEDLIFQSYDPPIGHYEIQQKDKDQ